MFEIEELKKLAKGIVLTQGNIFIKELLRKQKIKIGATKADFQKNMLEAIEIGGLTRTHFDEWLSEVEGWGEQHIYLYEIPKEVRTSDLWNNKENVKKRVEEAGLGEMWEISPSQAFPEKRTLSGIYFHDNIFRLDWYEGDYTWMYEKDKDYEEMRGLDKYLFKAFRESAKRSVMRFEWPLDKKYAGLFLQLGWDRKKHQDAKDEVFNALKHFMTLTQKDELNLSNAIKNIDQLSIDKHDAPITSKSSRLQAEGAHIEFASDVTGESYSKVAVVRDVRAAAKNPALKGDHAVFILEKSDELKISRKMNIVLDSPQNRIRIHFSCKREEIWSILDMIKKHNN